MALNIPFFDQISVSNIIDKYQNYNENNHNYLNLYHLYYIGNNPFFKQFCYAFFDCTLKKLCAFFHRQYQCFGDTNT
jgi:hypothetical protein